jgi:5-methylcytosine-specific restriction endonuclease McrA
VYDRVYHAAHPNDPEKSRVAARRWNAAHPDRVKARNNAYYAAHREEVLAREAADRVAHPEKFRAREEAQRAAHREERNVYSRAYHAARRDKLNDRSRAYYHAHAEEMRATNREWYLAHPEERRCYESARRAKAAASPGHHTAADVAAQRTRQKGRCYWCGEKVGRHYHVDHVFPLSRGGGDGPENLVIACVPCNLSKNARLPSEWSGRLC